MEVQDHDQHEKVVESEAMACPDGFAAPVPAPQISRSEEATATAPMPESSGGVSEPVSALDAAAGSSVGEGTDTGASAPVAVESTAGPAGDTKEDDHSALIPSGNGGVASGSSSVTPRRRGAFAAKAWLVFMAGDPCPDDRSGGFKLMVGGFGDGTDADRLRTIFGEFGTVKDVLMKSDDYGQFAFVTMESKEECERAAENLRGKDFGGSRLQVNWAKPRTSGQNFSRDFGSDGSSPYTPRKRGLNGEPCVDEKTGGYKLMVGQLAPSVSDDQLRTLFGEYGNVKDVFVRSNDRGAFAFVTLETQEQAEKAGTELNGRDIDGSSLRINWARPRAGGPSGGPRGPSGSCFKCHLPGHRANDCPRVLASGSTAEGNKAASSASAESAAPSETAGWGSVSVSDLAPAGGDSGWASSSSASSTSVYASKKRGLMGDPCLDDRNGGYKLMVGQLADSVNDDQLKTVFGEFGTVKDVFVKKNDRGAFAFVTMETQEQAEKAGTELNGRDIDGSRLRINWAKPRAGGPSGAPRGPPGSCFKCHQPGHRANDCPGADVAASTAESSSSWGEAPTAASSGTSDTWGSDPVSAPASAKESSGGWGLDTPSTPAVAESGGTDSGWGSSAAPAGPAHTPQKRGLPGEPCLDDRHGGYKLMVGQLAAGVNDDQLRTLFGKYGSVKDVFVKTNDRGAFAFVTLETLEQAEKAGSELNGKDVGGSKLRISWARARAGGAGAPSIGPRGPPGSCFKCQQPGHRASECPGTATPAAAAEASGAWGAAPAATPTNTSGGWGSDIASAAAASSTGESSGGWGSDATATSTTAVSGGWGDAPAAAGTDSGWAASSAAPSAPLLALQKRGLQGEPCLDDRHGGYKLMVGQLSESVSDDQLRTVFGEYGSVKDVFVKKNDRGAFAFVTLETQEQAEKAGTELNGKDVSGSRMRISWARARTGGAGAPSGPRGPPGSCFKCQQMGHRANDCPGTAAPVSTAEVPGAWGDAPAAASTETSGGWGSDATLAAPAASTGGSCGGWGSDTATLSTTAASGGWGGAPAVTGTDSGWGSSSSAPSAPAYAPKKRGLMGDPCLDDRTGGYKLMVGQLADGVNDDQLRTLFGEYGTVKDVFVKTNDRGAFAFVTMETQEQAEKAGTELNFKDVSGSKLRINWAKPRVGGASGGPRGPAGSCFKCQQQGHRANDCPVTSALPATTESSSSAWGDGPAASSTSTDSSGGWGAIASTETAAAPSSDGGEWGAPPSASGTSSSGNATCFKCGQNGHRSSECSAAKTSSEIPTFAVDSAGTGSGGWAASGSTTSISATVEAGGGGWAQPSAPPQGTGSGWGAYSAAPTYTPQKQGLTGEPCLDDRHGGYKLMVGQLAGGISDDQLRTLFGEYGNVKDVFVKTNDRGAFAFVTLETQEQAEKAGAELNGKEVSGSKLRINWARPRAGGAGTPSGGPRGPPGSCFKCQQPGHRANDCPGTSAPAAAFEASGAWGETATASSTDTSGGWGSDTAPAAATASTGELSGGWGSDATATPTTAASGGWGDAAAPAGKDSGLGSSSAAPSAPSYTPQKRGLQGEPCLDDRHGGYKLMVGQLSESVSDDQLRTVFCEYGSVKDVFVKKNDRGAFAFVTLETQGQAEKAGTELNGKDVSGSRMRISWARARTGGAGAPSGPRGPPGSCFKCQQMGHRANDCPGTAAPVSTAGTTGAWGDAPAAVSSESSGGWGSDAAPAAAAASTGESSGGWGSDTTTSSAVAVSGGWGDTPAAATGTDPGWGSSSSAPSAPAYTPKKRGLMGDPCLDDRTGGYKLMVGQLADGVNNDQLRSLFGEYGTVKDVFVKTNDRGPFAFVTMETQEQAEKAGTELNFKDVNGSKLRINWAKPRAGGSSSGPRGPPGSCFKCQQPGHRANDCPGTSAPATTTESSSSAWGDTPAVTSTSADSSGGWGTPASAETSAAPSSDGGGWGAPPSATGASDSAVSGGGWGESSAGGDSGGWVGSTTSQSADPSGYSASANSGRERRGMMGEPCLERGGYKVMVTGLADSVTEDRLRTLFGACGDVKDLFVKSNDKGQFAFVTMATQEQAEKAGKDLGGKDVDGTRLKINWAKPRPGGAAPQNSAPRTNSNVNATCFKCGQTGHRTFDCTASTVSGSGSSVTAQASSGGGWDTPSYTPAAITDAAGTGSGGWDDAGASTSSSTTADAGGGGWGEPSATPQAETGTSSGGWDSSQPGDTAEVKIEPVELSYQDYLRMKNEEEKLQAQKLMDEYNQLKIQQQLQIKKNQDAVEKLAKIVQAPPKRVPPPANPKSAMMADMLSPDLREKARKFFSNAPVGSQRHEEAAFARENSSKADILASRDVMNDKRPLKRRQPDDTDAPSSSPTKTPPVQPRQKRVPKERRESHSPIKSQPRGQVDTPAPRPSRKRSRDVSYTEKDSEDENDSPVETVPKRTPSAVSPGRTALAGNRTPGSVSSKKVRFDEEVTFIPPPAQHEPSPPRTNPLFFPTETPVKTPKQGSSGKGKRKSAPASGASQDAATSQSSSGGRYSLRSKAPPSEAPALVAPPVLNLNSQTPLLDLMNAETK